MVKLAGPAMSLQASGTIAKTITYGTWKGRPYCRSRVVSANPKSGGQTGMRSMFRFLTQQWASVIAGDQATWEDRAAAAAIAPFNAYVSYNMFRWRNFLAPSQAFPEVETPFSGTLGAQSIAAGVRSMTVTQAITGAGNGWGLAFFRSTSTGFASAFSNLVRVLPFSGTDDIVFVDTPLAAGDYFYLIRSISDDGALGAEGAELTDTVV